MAKNQAKKIHRALWEMEARQEKDALVAIEGAVPIKLEEPLQGKVGFTSFNPTF